MRWPGQTKRGLVKELKEFFNKKISKKKSWFFMKICIAFIINRSLEILSSLEKKGIIVLHLSVYIHCYRPNRECLAITLIK